MSDTMNQDKQNGRKNLSSKMKNSFRGRKFTSGLYASLVTSIVLIIIVVINLIVTRIDLQVDLSSQDLYTLTSQTLGLLSEVEDDITIYYLAETGNENTLFVKIAEKYDSNAKNIKLEYKDPILYPQFASQYVDDEIVTNSFIVVNHTNGRAKYVANADMLQKEFNYTKLDYVTTGIDVEGQLTSAIQYVTTENIPTLYATIGHSELETGTIFQELLKKQNVQMNIVTTLIEDIPEDCDILFIHVPQTDFNEDEIDKIKNYMKQGGNVVTVLDYHADNMPNVKSLLKDYGMEFVSGIVCEGDSTMYSKSPQYVVPTILQHDITAATIASKRFAIMPNASGLKEGEEKVSTITLSPLLATSDYAYSKADLAATTLNRESSDIEGPFYLGMMATDYYQKVTSKLVVYTGAMMFNETAISQYGNATMLTGTMAYLGGDIGAVSVKSKTLIPESLYVTQQQGIMWGAITIIVLPVIILACGIIITIRRRRR